MRFLDLLPASRVQTGLVARDKADLIERLAQLLAGNDDIAPVRDALVARERLGTTALGHGVAIPHGRSAGVNAARAAFVRLASPIDFNANDNAGVDLVAALIVPAHFTDQHLKLLAELAELFSNADVTSTLRTAPNAGALRELLHQGLRAEG